MRAVLVREKALLGQIAVTLAGAGASRGLLLLAVLVAARVLGPGAFGVFALGQTTTLLLGATLTLGQPVTLARSLARASSTPAARARSVQRALRLVLAVGVPTVLLSAVLPGLVQRAVSTPLPGLLLPVAALSGLCFALCEVLSSSFQGLLRSRAAAALLAGRAVTGVVLLCAALGVTHRPELLLLALAVADGLGAAVGWAHLTRLLRTGATGDEAVGVPAHRRTDAGLAARAFVAGLALQVCLWLSQVLLARSSLVEVGHFSFAYRWVQVLLFAPAAAAPLLLPRLTARAGQDRPGDPAVVYAVLSAAVVLPGALLLALVAPALAGLQGPGYAAAVPVLRVLAVLPVVVVGNNVLSQLALARGRDGAWLASDLLLSLGLVVVAGWLVPRLGAPGLGWAYVVAYTASCACLLVPAVRRRLTACWAPRPAG